MRVQRYRLATDGRTPIAEPDLLKWAHWFETADRHVADDHCGDVRVSTVFLGADHQFCQEGSPLLWETMIWHGPHDRERWCYGSWEEAVAGHAHALNLVNADQ